MASYDQIIDIQTPTTPTKRVRTKAAYLDVQADLRKRLLQDVFPPGTLLPTRRELAHEYGVAVGTLERALDNLISEGLLIAHPGRGTFAAQTKRRQTGLIGLVGSGLLHATRSPYWSQVINGIQDVATRSERSLLLLGEPALRGLDEVDGVIVADGSSNDLVREKSQVPRAALLAPVAGIPSVTADDFQGMWDMTSYLINLGHKRIAILEIKDNPLSERRYAGYVTAFRQANVNYEFNWCRAMTSYTPFTSQNFVEAGYMVMQNWIADNWRKLGCTALLCHNDDTAIGVLQALDEAGIDVPEELSVVGFDGADAINRSHDHLTTIEVPLREIGTQAMRLLLRQIDMQDPVPTVLMIPTRLRIGTTTSAAPK